MPLPILPTAEDKARASKVIQLNDLPKESIIIMYKELAAVLYAAERMIDRQFECIQKIKEALGIP